ncbi:MULTISPECIES: hypothetical protein [Bacteria]|uniref:hypothetical protein n=1 Tax=Bacteria TaxID=2 RepID=UPI0025B77731|nr:MULTISPECIES: hypothetical protein [Bacteria]
MSRRTSEASKAIRTAWLKEQELVSEGRGTRDWTAEQQEEILKLGKAYYHSENPDDVNDGKAFEGHHMKSAEAYPEYQGDPENIQFLSRPEHHEAHGGDYRNPTNWYFDPVTKTRRDFGSNKYEPCKIIGLSNPVVSTNDVVHGRPEATEISSRKGGKQREDNPPKKASASTVSIIKPSPKARKSFGERIMNAIEIAKDFGIRHPYFTRALKFVGMAAIAVGTEAIANSNRLSGGGLGATSSDDYSGSSSSDGYTDSLTTDIFDDALSGRDYPDERSSPEEHTVQEHRQRYHTKDGVVWKKKEPYQRGGNHDED